MNCPDCGGPMWDNRNDKRNPKSPDFKCKNKSCNKGIWEADSAKSSNGNGSAPHHVPVAVRPIGPLYNECLDFAKKACFHHFGNDCATSDIVAAAATLFIQATRDNAPLRAVAVVPVPVPPPAPVAAPAPVPSGLPF